MRMRKYLTIATVILLVAILIIMTVHWEEIRSLIVTTGSEVLTACLNIALHIGIVMFLMSLFKR